MNKLEAAIKMLECYSYANDTPFHTKTIEAVIELLTDFDNEEYKTSPRAIALGENNKVVKCANGNGAWGNLESDFQPNAIGLISQIFNPGEK